MGMVSDGAAQSTERPNVLGPTPGYQTDASTTGAFFLVIVSFAIFFPIRHLAGQEHPTSPVFEDPYI